MSSYQRYAYLTAIAASGTGVLALDQRLGTGVRGRRLARTVAVAVPVFLAFDLVGAARGWFASNPARNSLIVPPGIPLEEPLLLGFLTLVSVALRRGAERRR
ncbi:MAG TPA: lycopene cyclase domain-containing protein [Actinomycetes bacterium]